MNSSIATRNKYLLIDYKVINYPPLFRYIFGYLPILLLFLLTINVSYAYENDLSILSPILNKSLPLFSNFRLESRRTSFLTLSKNNDPINITSTRKLHRVSMTDLDDANNKCLQSNTAEHELATAVSWLISPQTGAISTYFDPERPRANHKDPYMGNLFFSQILSDDQKPTEDTLTNVYRWIQWYIGHVTAYYSPYDNTIHLMNGDVVTVPTYWTPVDGQGYALKDTNNNPIRIPYTSTEQPKVNYVMRGLSITGTIFKFYVNDAGQEVPSFSLYSPYLADMRILSGTESTSTSEAVDADVYDSTDSYGATFISLVHYYMKAISAKDAKSFLLSQHHNLKIILNSSFAKRDPFTGLTHAAPFQNAEYTMDNAEVWAGFESYLAILQQVYPGDSLLAAPPFDDGSLPIDEWNTYLSMARNLAKSMHTYLQIKTGSDAGLYYIYWNPNSAPQQADKLQWNDPSLSNFLSNFLLAERHFPIQNLQLGLYSDQILDKLFARFNQYEANYESFANLSSLPIPPNLWMFIPFVLNASKAKFAHKISLVQLDTLLENACEIFIQNDGRNWQHWNSLESGAYIRSLILLNLPPNSSSGRQNTD